MLHIRDILVYLKSLKVEQSVDEFLEEEGATGKLIQSLSLDKTVFKTKEEALEWADLHYFRTKDIEERDDEYIVKQLDATEFKEGTFQNIEVRRGVVAKVGSLDEMPCCETMALSLRNDDNVKLSAELPHVIEIFKVVKGVHPVYGEINITKETLKKFKENFDNKATGVDLSIDFDHETREAAGWVKSVWLSENEEILFGEVVWTPKGALSVKDKEFRYYSPMFSSNFVHPHTMKEFGPTLTGGALVNHPFLKMDAITNLKDNPNDGVVMDTIKLSEHKEAISLKDKEIAEMKLSEEKTKGIISGLKDENKKLSEENKTLKEEKAKAETKAKNEKLFADGCINKAQLDALNGGKELYEVLSLGEKMNTDKKGGSGENKTDSKLSDEEKAICKRMEISEEEFLKYNEGVK